MKTTKIKSRSKVLSNEIVCNPHLDELSPDEAAEFLGVEVEYDGINPETRLALVEVYVLGIQEVVEYATLSDRTLSSNPRFLFSRS